MRKRKNGIRHLVEEHVQSAGGNREKGLLTFTEQMVDVIEEENYDLGRVNIRELYEAMCDPQGEVPWEAQEVSEAMMSAGYPTVVGALIHPKVIKAYEPIANVVMPMVSEVDSNHKEETHGGFGALDDFEMVREGMEYEEAQPAEIPAKIKNNKFGRVISITMEMVRFDQTGEVLLRAGKIGKKGGYHLHKMIVQKACSLACAATGEAANQSLVLDGTARTMYANDHSSWDVAANDNLTGTVLSSDSVTASLGQFASIVDDKGEEMEIMPTTLLVHTALKQTAKMLTASPALVLATWSSGVINPHEGEFNYIVSPFVDSATSWYIGDFAAQTILQWVYRMRTEVRKDSQLSFSNDIVAQFKAGYYVGCGCTDYRHVQKGNT